MSYATYDSYKDSGVDWLGKIPSDWDLLKVKNIFRLVMKFAPKNNDCELLSVYTDIGVKPRKELEERGNRATTTDGYLIVEKGDIVVNKLLAWMGAIGLSDYDGVTSPAYDVLKPKMPIEGIFYHLLFRSPQCTSELKRHSRGIMDMRLRLYFDKFGDVVVPYPNIEVQKKIVSFLAEKTAQIDQAIALKQQQIEKLNEYKQILIQNAVTKGLNPNAPMKDSGVEWIGDIPEHWEVKKLKFLCNFDTGNKDTVNAIDDGAYPLFVRSQNIERIDEFTHDCEAVLTAGDGAGVGKVFHYYKGKFCFHQRVYMFNNFREISGRYFYYYFSSLFYKVALDGSAKSTVDSLRRPMIANFPIVYPETQEQLRIVEYLDKKMNSFIKSENLYQTQIDRLKEYKNILINQAVTGKIKI